MMPRGCLEILSSHWISWLSYLPETDFGILMPMFDALLAGSRATQLPTQVFFKGVASPPLPPGENLFTIIKRLVPSIGPIIKNYVVDTCSMDRYSHEI